jgi:hypothetical protein
MWSTTDNVLNHRYRMALTSKHVGGREKNPCPLIYCTRARAQGDGTVEKGELNMEPMSSVQNATVSLHLTTLSLC